MQSVKLYEMSVLLSVLVKVCVLFVVILCFGKILLNLFGLWFTYSDLIVKVLPSIIMTISGEK